MFENIDLKCTKLFQILERMAVILGDLLLFFLLHKPIVFSTQTNYSKAATNGNTFQVSCDPLFPKVTYYVFYVLLRAEHQL